MKKVLLPFFLVFFTQLQAQTWHVFEPDLPDTVGMWHIDAVDDNVAWACAIKWTVSENGYGLPGHDKGYYLKTADGGQTWSAGLVPLGAFPFFSNICGLDAQTAWASGLDRSTNESFVQHTSDGGQTWERKLENGFKDAASYVNFVHFWDEQHGLAMGDPISEDEGTDPFFEIYRTEDGGENWQRVARDSFLPTSTLPGEFGIAGYYQVVGNSVWFSTTKGNLYYSANRGQSWLGLQATPNMDRISFADSLFGVLSAPADGDLKITEDGGLTWTSIPAPPQPGYIVSLVAIPESHYLLAVLLGNPVNGPYATVISRDLGATWQVLDETQNACVAAFASPTAGYAGEWQPAGRATRMYSYNGDPLSGILSGKALEADISLSPNPASDMVRVSVETPQPADFLLLVHDANGRLMKRQVIQKADSWNVTLDVRSLPKGLYTLTISTKEGMLSRQLVKQ
jgi:photosystem II stability/assembly factor-like uncharacterized protein